MTRKVFFVVPHTSKFGKSGKPCWQVLQKTKTGHVHLRTSKLKTTAIAYAKRMAKSPRHLGQVVVLGRNGAIQTEWTYGADPVRSPG